MIRVAGEATPAPAFLGAASDDRDENGRPMGHDTVESAERAVLLSLAEALGDDWRAELVDDFGPGGAMALMLETRKGSVEVVPCTVDGGRTDYRGLQGYGAPHYLVQSFDGRGRTDSLKTCNLSSLVARLNRWAHTTPAEVSWRQPFSAKENRHLRLIAARMNRDGLPRVHVEADIEGLSEQKIAFFFPRGDDGRLAKASVLLAPVDPMSARSRRGRWIHIARAPVRTEGQALHVIAGDFIAQNAKHRWDETPQYWRHEAPLPEPAPADQMALLDEGQFAEAFDKSGVPLDRSVLDVLAAEPPSLNESTLVDAWRRFTRRLPSWRANVRA